jgi:ubiquinone/menaquinone biosynthesis C-methylase UbiE
MLSSAECRQYQVFVEKYQPYLYPLLGARFARLYGRRGGRIIDMGTGPGYLTAELAARTAAKIHAVDINPAMHELAREQVRQRGVEDQVSFDLEDVHALSYPDRYADLVVSYSCFHHWADPMRAIRECHRVLGAGGRLVLVDTHRTARAALGALRKTIVEPELFRFVHEALEESYALEKVHETARAAGLADYELVDFHFEEEDLVECLDAIGDAPAPGADLPEGVAMSWMLTALRAR